MRPESGATRPRLWRAATLLIPAVAIAAVWYFADLSSYHSAADVSRALNALAARPFGWALVPLGFAAGAIVFIPVNALIAGVTLSFEPVRGFAFAMTGGLIAAVISYGVGRLFGSSVVALFRGPKIDRVIAKLRENPLRTSLVMHLLPIGNFTGVNLLAGALHVPLPGFMLGTTLGLLPGVVFFIFIRSQLNGSFGPLTVVGIVVGIALIVGIGVVVRRWVRGSPTAPASA